MEHAMMLAAAKHISATETYTAPDFYYCTLANGGVEVSGLTRGAFIYDDPLDIDETNIQMRNATAISIDTPDGTADEAWVMLAATGGEPQFRCPFDAPITLTDGGTKVFDVHDLTHLFTNTTPAAP